MDGACGGGACGKEVEGGRVIIVFTDDSFSIPETSRNDLNNFIQANQGKNVEILAFFKDPKDIEPNGIVFQRIESAKKFLTGSGFKGQISIRSKESEAKLQSSRYVFVSLK